MRGCTDSHAGEGHSSHRLHGLRPDSLLAFLVLLGALRSLEESHPEWRPRAFWSPEDPPMRPTLLVRAHVCRDEIAEGVVDGLNALAARHEFGGRKNPDFSPSEAEQRLEDIRDHWPSPVTTLFPLSVAKHPCHKADDQRKDNRYLVEFWSAIMSDAAAFNDGNKVEPTPLCAMFGNGRQYFLERLEKAGKEPDPLPLEGGSKHRPSELDSIRETLFSTWTWSDANKSSFRWDPSEDARYALRAGNPTDEKKRTQHGANRIAAVGFSTLTVFPRRVGQRIRLGILGGRFGRKRTFAFSWPIWRYPTSLSGVRALLNHPDLNDKNDRSSERARMFLGISDVRRARKVSGGGRTIVFTAGESVDMSPDRFER